MRKQRFHIIGVLCSMLILSILLLTACGGGGSVAGGGIGGTGVVASGAVADKGSVHINGVIYTTTGAAITLDDSSGADTDIRRGMVVRIDGSIESNGIDGTADFVTYEDVVEGPLTFASAQPADIVTLTVLGQTVIVEEGMTYVDDGTVSAPTPLPQTLPIFAAVTHLEVSGFRDASAVNGVIRATYIKIKSTLTEYEVKGVVENVTSNSFDIAGLQVDFAGTLPTTGETVEVKGLATGFTSPPDTLVATSVETRTAGLGETAVEHAEIEGFITSFDIPAGEFKLNGQTVDYSGATFEGGAVDDLTDGVKVEAEGSITGGVLVADQIEFKESIRIEGDASDSDADGSFSIEGLTGLTIFVDSALTEYDGFSNVGTGNHLRIRGREISGTGNILATEIRLRSADTRIEFQATATAFTVPPGDNVTLMGTINVDTTDPFTFKNLADVTITRAVFYSNLAIGNLVKIRGDLVAGSTADWQEIEFED